MDRMENENTAEAGLAGMPVNVAEYLEGNTKSGGNKFFSGSNLALNSLFKIDVVSFEGVKANTWKDGTIKMQPSYKVLVKECKGEGQYAIVPNTGDNYELNMNFTQVKFLAACNIVKFEDVVGKTITGSVILTTMGKSLVFMGIA